MKDIENIFLDLDSNIIHSVVIKDRKINQGEFNNLKYYDYFDEEDKDTYRIFLRPYLEEFLDYIFKNYNVSVFTAADKPYALFIAENIICKKNRKIDYIFWEYHTAISEKVYSQHKSMRMIQDVFKLDNYTLKNTVIMDDNYHVYFPQKNNCIISIPFYSTYKNSSSDKFLINLLKMIKNNRSIDYINKDTINYLKKNKISLTDQDDDDELY